VEAAAARLRISNPTAYRYFRSLASVGLISLSSRAAYVLGPAIIEMDREIRLCDPMLNAARDVMTDLIRFAGEESLILLCRIFRDRVICIHQVTGQGPQTPVSYERGRPMPLSAPLADETMVGRLVPLAIAGAREIERAMAAREERVPTKSKIRATR
jgi:DNA-binding IclR family transcriptional regulator